MDCNWQIWNILVCLENCGSARNPTLHTQLIFKLHESLKSISLSELREQSNLLFQKWP